MGRSGQKRTLEQEVLKQAQVYSGWKEQVGVHSFEDVEAKALEVAREVARALMSYGVADEELDQSFRSF